MSTSTRALIAAADQAMRAGDPAQAAALLERFVAEGDPRPDELLRVAATRRAIGDAVGALDALSVLLRTEPRNFLALLMGGSLLLTLGRKEDATRSYEAALRAAPPLDRLPPVLRTQLDRARAHVESEHHWRRALLDRSLKALDGADVSERARIEGFRDAVAHRDAAGFLYPGLETIAFFDPDAIPGVAALEAGFEAVLAELHAVMRSSAPELFSFHEHAGHAADPAAAPETGKPAGKWSVIHLICDGKPSAEKADACPETMRLYRGLNPPAITGRSPNLMFSLLDPRTRIAPHKGITNTRCVLHLPLIVPPGCGIRVAEETRRWEPGRALVFDDSLEHEAWNDSDLPRIILLCDIWRPELTPRERLGVAEIMAIA